MKNYFIALGGKVLPGPDNRRITYSHSQKEGDLLFQYKHFSIGGIKYIKTDLRIEKRSFVFSYYINVTIVCL